MADHYYTKSPESAHKPLALSWEYRGATMAFQTDSGVFSHTEIDRGTELLLSALPETMAGSVLDMGCGYGVIGVSLGRRYPACQVLMADVNERACGLAMENAKRNGVSARVLQSDGYAALGQERFDFIVQNPPIRAGKKVIYEMFFQASKRLTPGGSLWLVIRKQQGAPSAVKRLEELFETVTTVEKQSGYWVLRCVEPKDTIQRRE